MLLILYVYVFGFLIQKSWYAGLDLVKHAFDNNVDEQRVAVNFYNRVMPNKVGVTFVKFRGYRSEFVI